MANKITKVVKSNFLPITFEGRLPVYAERFNALVEGLNDLGIADSAFTPENLNITGDLSVGGETSLSGTLEVTGTTTVNALDINGLIRIKGTPQTLTGAGAVNLTTSTTLLVTTGANALTLAAGADGQIKIITMKTDGGDGTLTPTGLRGGTTITFSAVGQSATLLYKDSAWLPIALVGAVLA